MWFEILESKDSAFLLKVVIFVLKLCNVVFWKKNNLVKMEVHDDEQNFIFVANLM